MEHYDFLRSFFGWGSFIGIVILCIISLFVIVFRKWTIAIHQKMINLSEEQLNKMYFKFLAYFKMGVYLFFIIPYLALCFMK